MKTILVKNNLNNYNIVLGYDAFSYFLESFNFPNKVLVVISKNVSSFYQDLLNNKNFNVLVIKDGEESKSLDSYIEIISNLERLDFSKSDLIIAIGGGTVIDLCGFVASTYKRGINYIIVPTTFLSMIDASIGGKNALNFNGVKNMIGTFYMPNMIIDSYDFLESLTDNDYASGLMEALKAGIIGDFELVKLIKDSSLKEIRNNIFLAESIITKAIEVKKKIVEDDPYEEDHRRVLNLGHTIGHAIEALNFKKISHGEAIALGMIPFLSSKIKEEVKNIIKNYFKEINLNLDKNELINLINKDKKIKGNDLYVVFANDYEDCVITKITIDKLMEKLDELNIWK